jgi:hypothetical protein
MTRIGSVGVLMCVALAACGSRGSAARRAAADTATTTASPPEIAISRFDVPLSYDITNVLGLVEHAVPTHFGSLDSTAQAGDDPARHYSYEAVRSPFSTFSDGAVFHLQATLTYKARGFFKPRLGPTLSAGCGTSAEHPPQIIVDLATPLSLTAHWHLVSHTKIVRIDRASDRDRDRCQVRLLHYNVTQQIIDAARAALTNQLPQIDSTISAVDLTSHVTDWWALLNRPVRLTDGVWLLLGPLRLRVGKVSGEGHLLTVHVGLDARPQIVTRATAPEVAASPLPPLGHDTVASGFHILMEGIVDYATASRALTAALRGQSVTQQGHSVTVDSLLLSPEAGGRLALTVGFHGDAQGTLRFVGVPRYDAAQHGIAMQDLDYDLQTDSPVITVYSWLRSDALRTLFREKALVPDAPALERGKLLLLDGLNRKIGDAMTITAVIDSMAVRAFYVTPQGLQVRAQASGHATVAVKER